MEYKSNFEYDLSVGQASEKALGEIFDNKTVEVKCDIKAKDTGNLFIEYRSRGKPSGIATSKADFYCFDIGHLFILIDSETLKEIVRPLLGTGADKDGGDENTSKGVLLPLTKLIKPSKND
jgi:hypothetical protein